MISEGHVELPRLSAHHADEAAIGTGLISRLPAFPQAPTDEILDLRGDLEGPLARYRAEVARMARDTANPTASGLSKRADIDQLWLERVEPALADLRDGFAEHSLVREIARALGRDLSTVINVGTGASVAVGLDAATSLDAWVTAAASIAAPAANVLGAAATARADAKDAVRKHELFFLYEVDRRLQI